MRVTAVTLDRLGILTRNPMYIIYTCIFSAESTFFNPKVWPRVWFYIKNEASPTSTSSLCNGHCRNI